MADEKQVDIQLPKYYKSDFKKLSWKKYFKVLDNILIRLKKYFKENKIQIHAVVPILRGGNFPGTYFAYQLHILRILPVQYKYFFNKGKIELKRMFDLPLPAPPLPEKPNFLLVENNQCYGTTAERDRKSTRLNSSHSSISYAVFCLKKNNVHKRRLVICMKDNKLSKLSQSRHHA